MQMIRAIDLCKNETYKFTKTWILPLTTPPNKFEGATRGSINFEGVTPGSVNNAKLDKMLSLKGTPNERRPGENARK